MFTRILYATDGSEHAQKALEYVLELARMHGAEVILLHAFPPVSDLIGAPYRESYLAGCFAAGTDLLDEVEDSLKAADIPVVRELLEGPAAEAILRVAEIRDCDLIVLGARGLSNLQGLLLGSVSHKVIQHANCPVLVVR